MAVAITIGGVAKDIKAGSLNIQQTANGRSTASFTLDSADGTYRPALDAEVIITENSTTIFAGLLERPREKGIVEGAKAAISTAISVVDYHAYAERRYVNETLAAGTLKSMLTTLVTNYLSVYGVTLDAGQVDGPSLPELEYQYNKKLSEVLNELATLTADSGEPYVWTISPTKVLSMAQPSTVAAPFNVVGSTLPIAQVIGDIEVETRREHYANRIIIKMPPRSQTGHVETFTGDGSTHSFSLQYTLTAMRYIVTVNGVDELLTFEGIGFDLAVQWLYYASDNTIRRLTTGVADPPANGATISITFDGMYEAEATAEDAAEIAAHGPWERVIQVENIPSDTTAQALADAYLAKSLYATKTVTFRTHEAGVAPGQSLTINVPRRNVNDTAVVTDVSTRDFLKDRLERRVTAVIDPAQTNLDRGFRDTVKVWSGDKTGGAIAPPSVSVGPGIVPPAGGAAPPERAIQYYKAGRFGGDAAFLYYEDENSIVCGDDSSITAAAFAHCAIFGQFCEIADPS